MASAVDKQPAAARLSAVAAAGCLPTATRGNQSSYTTLWDTTGNPLDVFGMAIPSPIASSRGFHELMEEVHDVSGHLFI